MSGQAASGRSRPRAMQRGRAACIHQVGIWRNRGSIGRLVAANCRALPLAHFDAKPGQIAESYFAFENHNARNVILKRKKEIRANNSSDAGRSPNLKASAGLGLLYGIRSHSSVT